MEVILDIKNVHKVMNPTVDNVIVFNGKQWYLTSKESLLADAYKILNEAKTELENIKAENLEFKKKVGEQLYKMSEIIQKLYEDEK